MKAVGDKVHLPLPALCNCGLTRCGQIELRLIVLQLDLDWGLGVWGDMAMLQRTSLVCVRVRLLCLQHRTSLVLGVLRQPN